jgi:hypothetical protein
MYYFAHGDEVHETVTSSSNLGGVIVAGVVVAIVVAAIAVFVLKRGNKKPASATSSNDDK